MLIIEAVVIPKEIEDQGAEAILAYVALVQSNTPEPAPEEE